MAVTLLTATAAAIGDARAGLLLLGGRAGCGLADDGRQGRRTAPAAGAAGTLPPAVGLGASFWPDALATAPATVKA